MKRGTGLQPVVRDGTCPATGTYVKNQLAPRRHFSLAAGNAFTAKRGFFHAEPAAGLLASLSTYLEARATMRDRRANQSATRNSTPYFGAVAISR